MQQAALYEAWTEAALKPDGNLTSVEMAFYRMLASGVELLKPLLIWLHEPGRHLPQDVIDSVIAMAESWVIRRQLLRLTGSDLGRIVAELIHTNSGTPAEDLVERIRGQLSRLNVASTYWPGDDEIRQALKEEPAYRRYPRARLRMILEAIENAYRAETMQAQVTRSGLPIEHILPQKWQVPQLVDSRGLREGRFRAQRGLIRACEGPNVWTHELVVSCPRGAWFTD